MASTYNLNKLRQTLANRPPVTNKSRGLSVNSLPFDAEYEAQMDTLRAALAQLTSGSQLESNRINQDTLLSRTRLDKQRGDVLKGLEQRMADQGILRSGINIAEQGRVGGMYQEDIQDLARNQQRSLEDITRNTTGQRNAILGNQRTASAERIRRYTESKLQADEAAARAKANAALIRKLGTKNRASSNNVMKGSRVVSPQAAATLARVRRGY